MEKLSDDDKKIFEALKNKVDTARNNLQFAAIQKENAELMYDNILLRLAIKYSLNDKDVIEKDGTITRQIKEQEGEKK